METAIDSSGEGEVWETNFSGILAKIYHDSTPERIEKLKAMLANPPVDPMKSKNHISIAFPQDLLLDAGGNCVGFLMPAVRSSRELPSIYHPRLRKRNAPGFNWYYLHVTALNTAWIIQAIHEKGYVLGDIKPQNILVNDRALVAVIDTDSFQVRDSKTGKVYRCTVGSDGFTPVELLGKDFSTTDQTEICDRFRLAVLIHYLLFGYHPFSGEWTGAGESPDQTELIRKGLWYGGQNSLIRPSQTTIPLDVVHPQIKRLFLKCFNDGHTSPHLRPTSEDWHNALQVAVDDLTICGRVDSHYHSRSYGKCYWCERSAKLGVDIFPNGMSKSITASSKVFVVDDQDCTQVSQPGLNSLALTNKKWRTASIVGITCILVLTIITLGGQLLSPVDSRAAVRNSGVMMALAAGITGFITSHHLQKLPNTHPAKKKGVNNSIVGIACTLAVVAITLGGQLLSPGDSRAAVRNSGVIMALAAGITGFITSHHLQKLKIKP